MDEGAGRVLAKVWAQLGSSSQSSGGSSHNHHHRTEQEISQENMQPWMWAQEEYNAQM
jgi:hypothetical protein